MNSVVELNLFTRWLLKHYETSQDEGESFCYRNAIGEIVEIEDIVTHYIEEQKELVLELLNQNKDE